eukprot:4173210-Pyramimonas_sp.AAC.1
MLIPKPHDTDADDDELVSFDLCPRTPLATLGTSSTAVATPDRVGPLHALTATGCFRLLLMSERKALSAGAPRARLVRLLEEVVRLSLGRAGVLSTWYAMKLSLIHI